MMSGGFGGGRWMGRMGRGAYSRGTAGRQGYEDDDEGGQIYDHTVVTRLFGYLLPHWPRLSPYPRRRGGVHRGRGRHPVDGRADHRRLRADRGPVRTELHRPDFRGSRAHPARQPVPPPQDDGLGGPEGALHVACRAVPAPPGPFHELLQQERSRKGDVGCPERRTAAPGVPVHRNHHLRGHSQPGWNHRGDGHHGRTARPDNFAGHPLASRDDVDMAKICAPGLHEGSAGDFRSQRRSPGEHLRSASRPEHEPGGRKHPVLWRGQLREPGRQPGRRAKCRPRCSQPSSFFPR